MTRWKKKSKEKVGVLCVAYHLTFFYFDKGIHLEVYGEGMERKLTLNSVDEYDQCNAIAVFLVPGNTDRIGCCFCHVLHLDRLLFFICVVLFLFYFLAKTLYFYLQNSPGDCIPVFVLSTSPVSQPHGSNLRNSLNS